MEYKKTGEISPVIASIAKQSIIVPKADIIANGDYNLSMERYRTAEITNSDRPMVELGELIETITPPIKIQKSELLEK